MEIGICKLCHQEAPLCERSHIFSRFLYKELKNDKGQIFYFSTEDVNNIDIEQSGVHESGLFCERCDNNIMGSVERYTINHILQKNIKPKFTPATPITPGFFDYENLNNQKIKRFFLIQLFRAHHSKHDMFKNIDLGDHHESILREIISTSRDTAEDEYEVFVFKIHNETNVPRAIIEPRKVKIGLNNSYMFYLNEYIVHINISKVDKLKIFQLTTGMFGQDYCRITLLEGEIGKDYVKAYFGRDFLIRHPNFLN